MDANIRFEIFESFCYAIGAYANLRYACFCIRSIEGQININDSTGDLIAPNCDMAKRLSSVPD